MGVENGSPTGGSNENASRRACVHDITTRRALLRGVCSRRLETLDATAPHTRIMIANTCEARVGRLLEVRVDAGYQSVRDVDKMIVMMQAHFGRLPAGEKCIIAADWRNVTMMSPET